MIAFILRRIGGAIPVLLLVTLVTFALMRLIPGDPAAALAGVSATPQERAQIRHDLGLDEPYHLQLARWYGSLARGDLGRSILLGKSVTEATFERLPVTLSLSAYALVLTVVFGLALGVLAALRQNSWVDQAAMMLALVGISLPNFWLGLMMIVLFAVHLGWLPTGGYVNFTDDPWNWLRCTTMPANLSWLPCRWDCSPASPARPCWRCCVRITYAPRGQRACRPGRSSENTRSPRP